MEFVRDSTTSNVSSRASIDDASAIAAEEESFKVSFNHENNWHAPKGLVCDLETKMSKLALQKR